MRKPPFYKSFLNSIHGVFWMLKSERNFQLEIIGLILNLFLIVFLKLNATDTALILIVSFAVLSLEILNTAAEKICDIVQPEFDERVKIIKDISAAAVVLMSFAAICVGILVYWKYIF
ncbi:diacylglycerol kinase family protein [Kaistella sp. G5-32]|uniref:Diacylglycerol kinase family protein n=1 Tax=Kaistella gelatinilytica TaxID=2787636 RepID=A0ABS0F8T9_9FLAO|nr:diacylglycerol kinase family protein [Kaistella gelatinilytica]MBF8456119.1 diacylglycerol kinase family protein [Kaistella gelatinilytica]